MSTSLNISSDVYDDPNFVCTLSSLHQSYQDTCNNLPLLIANIILILEAPCGPIQISHDTYKAFAGQLKPVSPYQEKFLSTEEFEKLTEVLHIIFGNEISFP